MNTKSIAMLSLACLVVACGGPTDGGEEDVWWEGTEEPATVPKGDEELPLTIFLARAQTTINRILDEEQVGDFGVWRTGYLPVDGVSISEDTVLVFEGQLHSFDGVTVEDHLFVVDPKFWSHAEGAANESGFLMVDFKNSRFMKVHEQSDSAFGETSGIFRGTIIATNELELGDKLPSNLRELMIRPSSIGQRPPNTLRNVEIIVSPTAVLSQLSPEGGCLGDDVVDNTNAGIELQGEVALAGFPIGQTVNVEVEYSVPHRASESTIGRAWAWVKDQVVAAPTQHVDTVTVEVTDDLMRVALPPNTTVQPPLGADLYTMEVTVTARAAGVAGAFAQPYRQHLYVSTPGAQVVVDQFELCPLDDELCRQFRDGDAPDNVIARRRTLESKAEQQGLYSTIRRPLGQCSGGDMIAGTFADSCNVYREEDDVELSAKVAAELNFELAVNGEAQGEASWGTQIQGLAAADIGGAFKAAFDIDANLSASFKTSRTWERHSSLDVLYDPSDTQIQWWRVVTPRLFFLEVAEFDACGRRPESHEIFLSDLRESRLVLACENVPSFDTTCHAVEPTSEAVQACNELLIAPDSVEGQQCLAD